MSRHTFNVGDRVRVKFHLGDERYNPTVGLEATVIECDGQYLLKCDFGTSWQHVMGRSFTTLNWEVLEHADIRNFYLVAIQNGAEVVLKDHPTFHTGAEASAYAVELTRKMGCKVQPRRIVKTDDWRGREQSRLDSGEYERMPAAWDLEPIADHFLHRSKIDRTMVSFTESAEKAIVDRQTRMSPGKYLNRYYPDMPQEDRKRYIAVIDTNITVQFAATADEIEDVYARGPDSCMAGPYEYPTDEYADDDDYEEGEVQQWGHRDNREFDSCCHPVRVYGDSDLQVAYLSNGSRVTARSIVWPEQKVWVRAYGDVARLERGLESLGYKRGSIVGARIRRIKDDGNYVMPYLDGESHARDLKDGKFLVIDPDGEIIATNTNGLGDAMLRCERTGDLFSTDEYDFVHVVVCMDPRETQRWVAYNLDEYAARWNGEWFDHDICTYVESADKYVPDHLLDELTFRSAYDDELYLNIKKVELASGGHVTVNQAREYCRTCTGTGGLFLESDMIQKATGLWYSADYLENFEKSQNDNEATSAAA